MYVMGMSVPSLYRHSTDSMICICTRDSIFLPGVTTTCDVYNISGPEIKGINITWQRVDVSTFVEKMYTCILNLSTNDYMLKVKCIVYEGGGGRETFQLHMSCVHVCMRKREVGRIGTDHLMCFVGS